MSGGPASLRARLEQTPALPLLLTLVVYSLTAIGRAIIDADEGVYAHIPQQMLARGDWLTPYVNGVPSLDKLNCRSLPTPSRTGTGEPVISSRPGSNGAARREPSRSKTMCPLDA